MINKILVGVVIFFLFVYIMNVTEGLENEGVNTQVDLSAFNERERDQLASYFNRAVEEAKSQLTQPEKGDKGEQGPRGEKGDAGGEFIRTGRIVSLMNDKLALDIEISPALKTVLKMEQFNRMPSQDWMFLPTRQIMNRNTSQCIIGGEGELEMGACVIDVAHDNIPSTQKWDFDRCGRITWDGNVQRQRCLAFDGGRVLLEECKGKVDECEGVEQKQMWWWN